MQANLSPDMIWCAMHLKHCRGGLCELSQFAIVVATVGGVVGVVVASAKHTHTNCKAVRCTTENKTARKKAVSFLFHFGSVSTVRTA